MNDSLQTLLISVAVILTLTFQVLFLLIPVWGERRSNKAWLPIKTRRSGRILAMDLSLFVLALGLLFLVTPPGSAVGTFMPTSADMRTLRFWNTAIAWSLAACALLLAWRWSVAVACVALLPLLLLNDTSFSSLASQQYRLDWDAQHGNSQEAPTTTIPMRFELMEEIPGAELTLNGVKLGPLPHETTAQELYAKVPRWQHEQVAEARKGGQDIITPDGARLSNWGWSPLHLPSAFEDSSYFYYRVDVHGRPGISHMSGMTQSNPGTENSVRIYRLDTVFQPWDDQIEQLLDRARLKDYQVDAEWCAAFDSFGKFGTDHVRKALHHEPQLEQLEQNRARLEWNLTDSMNSQQAFEKLKAVCEAAAKSGQYDTEGQLGMAVEVLVSKLDVEQVARHAVRVIDSGEEWTVGGYSYGPDRFATYTDGSADHHPERAGLWPLAHAVWRLDQRLDAQESVAIVDPEAVRKQGLAAYLKPERENVIERWVTPALLRRAYDDGDALRFAQILGGTEYERLIWRQDWRKPATDPFNGERLGIANEVYVNKWYSRLLWLRSPLGTAFRQQQQREILSLVERSIGEFDLNSGSFPDGAKIVFLDQISTAEEPSLAVAFLPRFEAMLSAAPIYATDSTFQLHWSYLAKLWPHSTPEQFITALRKAEAKDPTGYLSVNLYRAELAPEREFEILSAIEPLETAYIAQLPDDPEDQQYRGPKYKARFALQAIQERLSNLPCRPAAERLLARFQTSSPMKDAEYLQALLSKGSEYDDLADVLTHSDVPALQMQVLVNIPQHPTPERRKLLEYLLMSTDEGVSAAAMEVQSRLKELAKLPVVSRQPLIGTPDSN